MPEAEGQRMPDLVRLAQTGVRRLTPANATIFVGTFSLLHCAVKDEKPELTGLFRAVFALHMFPIHDPGRLISLHYTEVDGKDHEIGVIEDLSAFPAEQQELVRKSLAMQYHEQIIRRIFDVRLEYGLLFFDVETQRGREQFVMPWRGDRAEDRGEKGKILLDALDNRFVIPDVEALPATDRSRFTAFIYW